MMILYIVLGAVVGAELCYILLRNKLKITAQANTEIIKANEVLEQNNAEMREENHSLELAKQVLLQKRDDLILHIEDMQKQADSLYEKSVELANERMSAAAETMAAKYQEAENAAKREYEELIASYANDLKELMEHKQVELEKVNDLLQMLTTNVEMAVAANKRAEEMKQQQDFYKLNLSLLDIEEIKKLKSIIPYLRDSEPLNKVIWKVYYEKPYTDLIGRVVGSKVKSGIYKITNQENQMCYVGQAVNIADRWKQHIKRGLGAETPTKNKLYPAMAEFGVENFTFEIIEECEKAQLNDREDYWQEYFKAKEFGYSIK